MKRALTLVVLAPAFALVGGCGLKPLYAGGGSGAVATGLGQVEVAPIEGKAGWLVANALRDRLGAAPSGAARYRLQVKLDDEITGLAIRRDDSVARERRILRARYQLVELGQGGVVLDATAGSDAGIDVVGSEYATIAAESTALERLSDIVADQIVTRVAVTVGRTPPAP
ncbi:LPS assembly lipoprotein LptE [Sphingomonas radiodurans]|uniref:LPS assembly lipoprotein LptE n=1 Tax=Sphingomonas radiodurans TaxID=2890321 RepID=UPI001E2C708C|nr:LPS assembly lipoprotein LptE [Sphingomonas radiodurans]WBH18110.1 LPS assembly lipoprotein LptE [Sphingomonas radiodurans]